MNHNPGIGATSDLSLRVSVGALVRVVFKHPGNSEWMLALERKATLDEKRVEVKSQPFGGAVRILNLDALHNLIGDFHFDSERSRAEQDFRIFIRPSCWPALREFCILHLSRENDAILETDPTRELTEEFADALKITLQPEQYTSKPVATVVENQATPTENIHAKGRDTVRVYRIFEAILTSPALAHAMLENSEGVSHQRMCELALEDARRGGKGRANAVYTLPLQAFAQPFQMHPLKERNLPDFFKEHRFDETVAAILEGLTLAKYQRR